MIPDAYDQWKRRCVEQMHADERATAWWLVKVLTVVLLIGYAWGWGL